LGSAAVSDHRGDRVAEAAVGDPQPGGAEAGQHQHAEDQRGGGGATLDVALGAVCEVDRAVEGDHRRAHHARQQREGIEQAPELPV